MSIYHPSPPSWISLDLELRNIGPTGPTDLHKQPLVSTLPRLEYPLWVKQWSTIPSHQHFYDAGIRLPFPVMGGYHSQSYCHEKKSSKPPTRYTSHIIHVIIAILPLFYPHYSNMDDFSYSYKPLHFGFQGFPSEPKVLCTVIRTIRWATVCPSSSRSPPDSPEVHESMIASRIPVKWWQNTGIASSKPRNLGDQTASPSD